MIHEASINKGSLTLDQIHENMTFALYFAKSVGCNIRNIEVDVLVNGRRDSVLQLIWQIVRVSLKLSFLWSVKWMFLRSTAQANFLTMYANFAAKLRYVRYRFFHLKQHSSR